MPDYFKERSTRTYRQKQLFSKEELTARESLCVHEQSAFCTAACPMKLDAKAFTADMARGDFDAARMKLERIAPFPLILAHGCSGPCMEKCRLGELPGGDGVDIRALERAAMEHGKYSAGALKLKFKKKKTAAVFGCELFTLVLAGEIARKNYPLTFFVAESSARELLDKCAPFLSPGHREEETSRLLGMDMRIEYNSKLSPELIAERRGGFDIICASRALVGECDDVTLVTPDGVVTGSGSTDVLHTLWDARRAGVSVDRLAQGLDAGNMRGDEGPTESKLYTNMTGVLAGARVPENGVYSPDEAVEEANRCIQCRCEECVKSCVYLQHFKKFPRILTREIYNNVDIIMGDHMMNTPMNSCSLCSQCSVVCPNGYDMADICLKARENMVSTDKLSLAVHEFALLDMLFSNGEAFLARPQPGYERCKYVFFPGCQAGAVAPATVYKAYADLSARLEGGVALMLGCCGAIARWAGRTGLHSEQVEKLKAELHKLGDPTVVAGCPTCETELRDQLGAEVVGVWDILNSIGLPQGAERRKRPAVMHDSCAARGNRAMQESVRALAEKLGCELTETEWSGDLTTCCGYGGLVSQANPTMAHEMAEFCVRQSNEPFITYCMACRDRLAREGHESIHLLELVYASAAGAPPDISEKRRNRLALKEKLLTEIWREPAVEDTLDFTIEYLPGARELMDERMILTQDIARLLAAYRESGAAVEDADTGLLTATQRIGNVTFWVVFENIDGGCRVHRAYSHRMIIRKD